MVQNNTRYSAMMMARSNTLPLKWRNFDNMMVYVIYVTDQKKLQYLHFLLDCFKLQEVRNEFLFYKC